MPHTVGVSASSKVRDFQHARSDLLERLFGDATFSATQAMAEMVMLSEQLIFSAIDLSGNETLWAGGSLGRYEMLPNSDLDIFRIYPTRQSPPLALLKISGFDQVETADITCADLAYLTDHTLIDTNQFIDGRALNDGQSAQDVERLLRSANTYDRQHANMIAEYFYYRFFDFPKKSSEHGPNMKYSSGSSRTTLFFNFYYRIMSGIAPAQRKRSPEFLDGVAVAEQALDIRAPYRAIEMVQVAKNAAISTCYEMGDVRQRYISRRTLAFIYHRCERRWRSNGIESASEFAEAYFKARQELEAAIDLVVEGTVTRNRSADVMKILADTPITESVAEVNLAMEARPADAGAILAFGAWNLVTRAAPPSQMTALTHLIFERQAREAGGALMAIACCPSTPDRTLLDVVDWTARNRAGAYIQKLISRNENAGIEVRSKARLAYESAEFVTTE